MRQLEGAEFTGKSRLFTHSVSGDVNHPHVLSLSCHGVTGLSEDFREFINTLKNRFMFIGTETKMLAMSTNNTLQSFIYFSNIVKIFF